MVSIIVPIFNSEAYLAKCLDSICNQTFKDIEIILINDGSTDSSLDICQTFAQEDSRIKLITIENRGVSSARNYGIDIASGEFVMFIDSDDYIDHTIVEKMLKSALSTDSDLVICGHISIKNNITKNIFLPDFLLQSQAEIAQFVSDNYLFAHVATPWGKLYKKEKIIHMFDNTISFGEDILFNINYLKNIDRVCNISNCLYYYYSANTNSLSRSYRSSDYDGVKKGYMEACRFIDQQSTIISKENIAYKYYLFSVALLVKMHLVNAVKNREKTSFTKKLCYDNDFVDAISSINKKTPKDRILIWSIKHKKCRLIIFLTMIRAMMKNKQLFNVFLRKKTKSR